MTKSDAARQDAKKMKPIYVRTQIGFWVLIQQAAIRTRHPGGMSGYVSELLDSMQERIQNDAHAVTD